MSQAPEDLDFEGLVADALDSLPPEIASRMENVEVVVEDEPSPSVLATMAPGTSLFGLYHGIPLTQRGAAYGNVLPDKISIYRGPITRYWRDPDRIRAQIRRTVIHEIGHYFGMEEEDIDRVGYG